MITKKKIERQHLEKFLEHQKFPLCHIEESETPDFYLNLNDQLIAIEHTRLINPKFKQREEYRDEIVTLAQKRFESKYSEKLYCLFNFENSILKGGKEKEKYVNHIFDFVEDLYLKNRGFEFSIHSDIFKEDPTYLIERFDIDNIQGESHWQHHGAFLVKRIDAAWLTSKIAKKEKLIKKYKRPSDEKWLLFVSNFGTEASTHPLSAFEKYHIESDFDRIYMYSYMADSVERIK